MGAHRSVSSSRLAFEFVSNVQRFARDTAKGDCRHDVRPNLQMKVQS
jgi:hypothetical protein